MKQDLKTKIMGIVFITGPTVGLIVSTLRMGLKPVWTSWIIGFLSWLFGIFIILADMEKFENNDDRVAEE